VIERGTIGRGTIERGAIGVAASPLFNRGFSRRVTQLIVDAGLTCGGALHRVFRQVVKRAAALENYVCRKLYVRRHLAIPVDAASSRCFTISRENHGSW